MVKRSRPQSTESPSRFIWPRIAPPDSAFHCQTRSTNVSRPRSWRDSPSSASWRSTTFWVAMPAWSMPGSHSTSYPCIRRRRIERVLDRVVQRVADVQRTGHVRRRDDDAVRLPVAARIGRERAARDPLLVPTLLYLARRVLGGQGGFGEQLCVWCDGHAQSLRNRVRAMTAVRLSGYPALRAPRNLW